MYYHLGSTAITASGTGSKVAEARYKACLLRSATGVLRDSAMRDASRGRNALHKRHHADYVPVYRAASRERDWVVLL
jgi:23S rRNA maturation mini-RNase III